MSAECKEQAYKYFMQRTKRVYIERCTKIESFEEYLNPDIEITVTTIVHMLLWD